MPRGARLSVFPSFPRAVQQSSPFSASPHFPHDAPPQRPSAIRHPRRAEQTRPPWLPTVEKDTSILYSSLSRGTCPASQVHVAGSLAKEEYLIEQRCYSSRFPPCAVCIVNRPTISPCGFTFPPAFHSFCIITSLSTYHHARQSCHRPRPR